MGWRDIFKRGPAVSLNTSGASDISPLVQALTAAMQQTREGTPLARPEEWVGSTFGPGWPLVPEPLDAVLPTGQPEPRISEYPVSVNIWGSRDRQVVPWETLKKAAETPLFRTCIEIRKKEIASLDWAVSVSKSAIAERAKNEGRAEHDIEKELRNKYKDEIHRATDFWSMPDRRNGRDFSTWISLLLEEHLTWDAMAVYPRKTYGGELLDLMIIDGSTIKCLRDEQGGRPEPPAPAFQQVLYGFPRGEYTADTTNVDGLTMVPGALSAAQLIYERRVHRSWTPYGFSPTEQALLDGLLWQKRFQWMIAEYTEGAQAVEWLVNKGTSDWTPRQVLEYERALNDRLGGKTDERYRNPLLPPGIEPVTSPSTPERYKPDYDLFILKLVAAHFDVTIAELGFTEPGGLGSAGYHEGQADVQWRKATLPDTRWLQGLLTRIQTQHLETPPEIEFNFLGLEDEDEAAADAVADARTKRAVMTLNEDRARIGLPAYTFAEANMPMMQTARGVVFVEGASEQAPPGVMIEPTSQQLPNSGDTTAIGAAPAPKQGPTSVKPPGNTAKAALELVTWRTWERKHAEPERPFNFEYMTADLAAELDPSLLTDTRAELAKASGPGPKASSNSSGPPGSGTSNWSPYTVPSSPPS